VKILSKIAKKSEQEKITKKSEVEKKSETRRKFCSSRVQGSIKGRQNTEL